MTVLRPLEGGPISVVDFFRALAKLSASAVVGDKRERTGKL